MMAFIAARAAAILPCLAGGATAPVRQERVAPVCRRDRPEGAGEPPEPTAFGMDRDGSRNRAGIRWEGRWEGMTDPLSRRREVAGGVARGGMRDRARFLPPDVIEAGRFDPRMGPGACRCGRPARRRRRGTASTLAAGKPRRRPDIARWRNDGLE